MPQACRISILPNVRVGVRVASKAIKIVVFFLALGTKSIGFRSCLTEEVSILLLSYLWFDTIWHPALCITANHSSPFHSHSFAMVSSSRDCFLPVGAFKVAPSSQISGSAATSHRNPTKCTLFFIGHPCSVCSYCLFPELDNPTTHFSLWMQ